MPEELARFGISLPSGLLLRFDDHIRQRHYTNRSEAIRDLIRQELVREEWLGSTREVMGTITMVYDHHQPDLQQKLTALQHDYARRIVSSTHVHLDHHNCLEVLIVRGPGSDIGDLAERIRSVRGVQHATLSTTTTGAGFVHH